MVVYEKYEILVLLDLIVILNVLVLISVVFNGCNIYF